MTLVPTQPLTVLKPADFASDQDVRWCPGCGDYSILAQMKKVCAKLGMDRSKTVFVTGIGCSSRFPYYMNTYGFHSIHGRAPTFATGLKLARPDLNVWMVTGDGDGLSHRRQPPDAHHPPQCGREDPAVQQPHLRPDQGPVFAHQRAGEEDQEHADGLAGRTRSGRSASPSAAEATFAARAIDVDVKHLEYVLERAAKHVGTAFVEIYQNCNIFNDGAFDYATDKTTKSDTTLYLEHGKPLIFGKDGAKGIRLHGLNPEVVDLKTVGRDDLLIHDERAAEPSLAFLLSRMRYPDFPEPLGVFRDVEQPVYGDLVREQNRAAVAKQGRGDLQALVTGEETWTVG